MSVRRCSVQSDGEGEVRVRNLLRTYIIPTTAIVGSTVVAGPNEHPRIALKVERESRVRIVPLIATVRVSQRGRDHVVAALQGQTIIPGTVLDHYQNFYAE